MHIPENPFDETFPQRLEEANDWQVRDDEYIRGVVETYCTVLHEVFPNLDRVEHVAYGQMFAGVRDMLNWLEWECTRLNTGLVVKRVDPDAPRPIDSPLARVGWARYEAVSQSGSYVYVTLKPTSLGLEVAEGRRAARGDVPIAEIQRRFQAKHASVAAGGTGEDEEPVT